MAIYKSKTCLSQIFKLLCVVMLCEFPILISAQNANACTNPQFAQNVDINWITGPDTWYVTLGNSVGRLHMAELLQGRLLTYADDYSNMCAKTVVGRPDVYQGYYYGFSGRNALYRCGASSTRNGFVDCDYSNTGLPKHFQIVSHYGTYTDNRNINIVVKCYPNGETGWLVTSITKSLTDVEKQTVLNHVQSLGFDPSDNVPLYNEQLCH